MTVGAWAVLAGTLAVGGALLVVALMTRRPRRDGGGDAMLLLQQQLEALRTQLAQALAGQSQLVQQQLGELTTQMNARLREGGVLVQQSQTSLGERLDRATQVVGDVQKHLGELTQATARVYEVGRDVAGLHDILRAPKLRGGLGEFLLGDLLGQVLPSAHFTLQHGFKSGERVDAAIRLGGALVPIDAKFPLEDFRRLLDAADDDARTRARRAFVARVRRHVDDIAEKYIRPDEGTYDFALMYIPAENVFYEAVVRDDEHGTPAIAAYALEHKVVPVSPGCLYAYLQAIVLGLRGLRIESRAAEVLGQLARLGDELGRVREDVRLVGKHLGNAVQSHASADRRLDRLEGRLGSIAGGEDAVVEPVDAPTPRLRLS